MVKHTAESKRFLFNQLALVLIFSISFFSIIAVEAKAQQCTITVPPVFGLTIITHGCQGEYSTALPAWVDEMSVAIANKFGGIDKIPIYTMKITKDSDEVITASLQKDSGSNNFETAGGAIIKVNWADLSCLICPEETITTKIADAIFTYLATNLSGDWLKVPIHLIGPSRGASINSRLAFDLGSYGIWVDHFTSLDPQPLTSIGDWVVKAYNNVLFADNNYRRNGLLPWGEPVNGTYQRLLNDVVTDDGYYCNQLPNPFATAHSLIHAYYHGTIYYDTCVDSTSVQSNWYSSYYYPNFKAGYYFSRIGNGDRYSSDNSGDGNSNNPIDGLHYRLSRSNTNNREPLSVIYPALPNATFKPFDNKSDYNLQVGSPVDFTYYYQDADYTDAGRTLTISFSLDNDTNPFNDTGNNCYKKIGSHLENVKRFTISDRIVFNWTPTNNDAGSHYVQIKAEDADGHVRYDYLLKPINIRAVNQPESDLVIENFSITPNSGEPGAPVTASFTIHNIGSGPAYPSRTNIRLSSSSSDVTPGDTLLASIEIPGIGEGATYDISESVIISDVDTSGTYYVWVILDVNNEANQGSNTSNDKADQPFSVTVPPPPSSIGDYVQVYNTGTSGLRVRSPNACDSPLMGQNRFDLDTGRVVDGPQTCNLSGKDYQMWKIQWNDCLIGWSAENWLKKISSATISCDATPTITTSSPLPDGGVGYAAYGRTLQTVSGTTPYSWSIVSGNLPLSLSLNSSTGTISGTPTTSGTYNFRVRVTGNNGLFSEKDTSLTINPMPQASEWTWQNPLPQGNDLNGVWGTSSTDVFAVGRSGTILHYDGTTWTSMNSGRANDLIGVWGTSSTDVFAVGSAGTILHYDGTTWTPMSTGLGILRFLNGVWGTSSTDVFAVGGGGAILHYDGTTWTSMVSVTTYPLNGVWGTSSTDVFAAAGTHTTLHYDGTTWTPMSTGLGISEFLYGVWGTSSTDVFAVGSGGTILHYNGTTWTSMNSGVTNYFNGVWGTSSTDVFAVGSGGTILHYNGTTWTSMNSGRTSDLTGVWGTSSTDVFAVGSGGTILHYNGTTWTSMNSGTTLFLFGVWGTSSSDVFAVGRSGTILHYDGTTWTSIVSVTNYPLNGVWGTSSTDVFAVGDGGTILHYGGTTWTSMSTRTSNALTGVWGTSSSDVFAVGISGTILHYGYDFEQLDTDGDGIPDSWEITNFGNLTTAYNTTDYDNDGLLDKDEYTNNTNPKNTDSDNDGMPDGWDVINGFNPLVDDSNGDLDGDGLTNLQEYLISINIKIFSYDIDQFAVVSSSSPFVDEFDDDVEPPDGSGDPTAYDTPFPFSPNAERDGRLILNVNDAQSSPGDDVKIIEASLKNNTYFFKTGIRGSVKGKFRFPNGITTNSGFGIKVISLGSDDMPDSAEVLWLNVYKNSSETVLAQFVSEINSIETTISASDVTNSLLNITDITLRLDISTGDEVTASIDLGSDGTFDMDMPGSYTLTFVPGRKYTALFSAQEDNINYITVTPASAPADTQTGFTFQTQAATGGGAVQFEIYNDFNNNGIIDGDEWPMLNMVLKDNGQGWNEEELLAADSDPSSPGITTVWNLSKCNNAYLPVGNFIIQVKNALGEIATKQFSVTPALAPQTVTGTVFEEGTSTPIPNALCDCEYINEEALVSFAFTDSSGGYTLQLPSPGNVDIDCYKYGYTEDDAPPLSVPDSGITNLDLYLKPADTQITGTVKDSGTNSPVWGAEVWAEALSDEEDDTWTTTSIDGSFTLPVLAGRVEIGVDKYGYMETYSNLTVPSGGIADYNISLTPATTQITGIVTESGTGDSICGVEVEVETSEGWSWNETDVYGSFVLPVMPGDMTVCFYKGGYMSTCSNITVPPEGIPDFSVSLLPMDTQITGTVTEFGTGNHISGVEVVANTNDGGWVETISDSEGNYVLSVLSGMEWSVNIFNVPGYYVQDQPALITPTVGSNIVNFTAKPFVSSPCDAVDLTIKAQIDGRSHLLIQGSNVWWHHYDYVAPGRYGGINPTVLNCVEWYPDWPDDWANLYCDCDSSVYGGLLPPLPADGIPVQLQVISGRGNVSIEQQPSLGNNYTAIVEFDDIQAGPGWYEVVVAYITDITDTDGDGIPDSWEIDNFEDLTTADSTTDFDDDGLLDKDEYTNNTDPKNTDSDGDGIPDDWEVTYGLNPLTDDSTGDLDGDGITNKEEFDNGTDPNVMDIVYVDFTYTGTESGTQTEPYKTLAEAINAVAIGGEIRIKVGITSERFTGINKIKKNVTIKSYGGTATIGKQ